ncbi:hypothetical protein NEUTE2DRAFT_155378 [Neurospora tetrasperma FGSC 2509]|nr:hypothetical protein NEUTE2DRAFT_155378 [Neurospora tetrasperma FGSC 2509]
MDDECRICAFAAVIFLLSSYGVLQLAEGNAAWRIWFRFFQEVCRGLSRPPPRNTHQAKRICQAMMYSIDCVGVDLLHIIGWHDGNGFDGSAGNAGSQSEMGDREDGKEDIARRKEHELIDM